MSKGEMVECRFEFCHQRFERTHGGQRYCLEHRYDGERYREVIRVRDCGWKNPQYIEIKECEFPACNRKFKSKKGNTKYCPEHRHDGEKYEEVQRVKGLGWETGEYREIKECEFPTCNRKFKSKRKGMKYCVKHRYGRGSERSKYLNMKKINRVLEGRGYERGVSFEEAEMITDIDCGLYWMKRYNPKKYEKTLKKIKEMEGQKFYEIITICLEGEYSKEVPG